MTAEWLKGLFNKMTMVPLKSIEEINKLYDYQSEYPRGKKDSFFVACGQCEGCNDLQYIYGEKLAPHISKGIIKKRRLSGRCRNVVLN